MLTCEQKILGNGRPTHESTLPSHFEIHKEALTTLLRNARNQECMQAIAEMPPITPEGHVTGQMLVGRQALAHLDDGIILHMADVVATLSKENAYTRPISQQQILEHLLQDHTLFWLDSDPENLLRLVGFCKVVPHETPNGICAELGSVIITPEYGGNGCGLELVRQAVDQWSTDGVRLVAITNAANPANRVFSKFKPPSFAYDATEEVTVHQFFMNGETDKLMPAQSPQDLSQIKYVYEL